MKDGSCYPHWAYPSLRAFKAQKRADMRRLIKALAKYRTGCAYTPRESDSVVVDLIARLLDEAKDALSVKKWGR